MALQRRIKFIAFITLVFSLTSCSFFKVREKALYWSKPSPNNSINEGEIRYSSHKPTEYGRVYDSNGNSGVAENEYTIIEKIYYTFND